MRLAGLGESNLLEKEVARYVRVDTPETAARLRPPPLPVALPRLVDLAHVLARPNG